MKKSEARYILERIEQCDIRADDALDALAPAAGWDPEEPELPSGLEFRDSEPHGPRIISSDAFWIAIPPPAKAPEAKRFLLRRVAAMKAMVAAYNREREADRIEAEMDDAKLDEGLARICREEIEAEVQRRVQDERDRCARIVAAVVRQATAALRSIQRGEAAPDGPPDDATSDTVEENRCRREAFLAGEKKGAEDERAACLSIFDWLLASLPQGWDYARRMTEGARRKVESGKRVEADDVPTAAAIQSFPSPAWSAAAMEEPDQFTPDPGAAPGKPEKWPARLFYVFRGEHKGVQHALTVYENPSASQPWRHLTEAEALEAKRRWIEEPRLRQEVADMQSLFGAEARVRERLREERDSLSGWKDRADRVAHMIRARWPEMTAAVDSGKPSGSLNAAADPEMVRAYRVLTGKES